MILAKKLCCCLYAHRAHTAYTYTVEQKSTTTCSWPVVSVECECENASQSLCRCSNEFAAIEVFFALGLFNALWIYYWHYINEFKCDGFSDIFSLIEYFWAFLEPMVLPTRKHLAIIYWKYPENRRSISQLVIILLMYRLIISNVQ